MKSSVENFEKRAKEIFSERYDTLARKTDKLFAYLFIFQWLLGIAFALLISPRTWTGEFSQTHIHVYAAVFLGGLVTALPVFLIFKNPGATLNRMVVAVSQILFSVLLIHLTGGRIETHFHVFGSLAFLAFYRDWRPVLIATVVTAVDHLVRGALWPQSVYGVLSAAPWRAFEHAAWVLFEDFILFYSVKLALGELKSVSEGQARLEEKAEQIVQERNQVKLLFDLAAVANQSKSSKEAVEQTLYQICAYSSWPVGHAYLISDADSNLLVPSKLWYMQQPEKFQTFREVTERTPLENGRGLPGRVLQNGKAIWVDDVSTDSNFPRNMAATGIGVHSAFAFPVLRQGKVVAVLEFFSEHRVEKNEALLSVIFHVGQQIGQVFEREYSDAALIKAHDAVTKLNHSLEEKVKERTKQLEDSQQMILSQQQSLINTSKMSALGEMAGGVAHEINTPLAVIGMRVEQMEECVKEGELDGIDFMDGLVVIKKTVDRIAKIVSGLRFFAREGRRALPQKIKISSLIDETLSFCRERFSNHGVQLDVVRDSALDSLDMECRSVEISQVILNLLNNAYDAIEGTKDKWVRIQTADHGEYVEITVTDSGGGIPKDVRDKIMQPFFTTKDIGKGTGLGLSISKGIIEEHQGKLYLDENSPNTKFVVLMPKIQKVPDSKGFAA